MSKNKLAFVDLEFHKKTKSGDFLRNLFSSRFDITDFWYDTEKSKDVANSIFSELLNYEFIFFFQVLLPYNLMLKLKNAKKKIVWAPMYDGLPMSNYYWSKIKTLEMQIISFSGKIDAKLKQHNIANISCRYYLPPDFSTNFSNPKISIFFWYRGNIKFNDWIKYFKNIEIEKIKLLNAPDPKYKNIPIDYSEFNNYNVEVIDKPFLEKSEYLNIIQDCEVYICPRKQEGIGMTITEALAKGKFLIGYNDSTMCDYIVHNKNGFLFDDNTNDFVSDKILKEAKTNCEAIAINGYDNWNKSKQKIVEVFDSNFSHNKSILENFFLPIEYIKLLLKSVLSKN